ncbi:DUF92 domain-containing protein [Calidifontibacillus erzurumensis]|uniref:DUF92 domain-containing protein n=1 Tax=Calidifontibacillus erzurumensis TaxID=2741433 RepID=A0A8J8GBW5_9BACI|nr:DUF92 domain-containing protein [Calidifontibacillus erzurumensis]NSL50336.1 DUF92 domain-containing protein [Calidifontibacillus erzurumensis]
MSHIVIHCLLFMFVVFAAVSGYRFQSLTISGAWATVVVGTIIIAAFQFQGLFLLGTFFVTSSFWSKYKQQKKKCVEEKIHKSGARDCVQVFANGGMPAILGLFYLLFQEEIFLYMFIVSIATANSDTWASEIGSTSRKPPIHILTWKRVGAGTSGAISFLGTVSAFSGALLIGIISVFLWEEVSLQLGIFMSVLGFIGHFIDTVLGATVQITYVCPKCRIITEKTIHCQLPTQPIKGFRLFNNDTVNFLSILLSALLIFLFPMFWS